MTYFVRDEFDIFDLNIDIVKDWSFSFFLTKKHFFIGFMEDLGCGKRFGIAYTRKIK